MLRLGRRGLGCSACVAMLILCISPLANRCIQRASPPRSKLAQEKCCHLTHRTRKPIGPCPLSCLRACLFPDSARFDASFAPTAMPHLPHTCLATAHSRPAAVATRSSCRQPRWSMQSDGAPGRAPPPPPRGSDHDRGGKNVAGTGWARPTDVLGRGSGQLGPTVQEMARRRGQLAMGGLRQLPRVYPADEILNRAINEALRLKEDTSIKNSRQRARKWGAERLQLLSKGLTMPTGEILKGYDRVLKTLSPFEKVVADLTIKARELAGYGSLPDTIEGLRQLRKDSLAVFRLLGSSPIALDPCLFVALVWSRTPAHARTHVRARTHTHFEYEE